MCLCHIPADIHARPAVTCLVLASGGSQQAAAGSFRPASVCSVTLEVSEALWSHSSFPGLQSPSGKLHSRVLATVDQTDQSRPLLLLLPRVVIFLHRCTSGYGVGIAATLWASIDSLEILCTHKVLLQRVKKRP